MKGTLLLDIVVWQGSVKEEKKMLKYANKTKNVSKINSERWEKVVRILIQ